MVAPTLARCADLRRNRRAHSAVSRRTPRLPGEDASHLDSFTKAEWRAVARRLDADYTDAKFEASWDRYLALRRARKDGCGEA